MLVISNSSPIIALSILRKLEIFESLFGKIYIPQAIYREVVEECPDLEEKAYILKAANDFILWLVNKKNTIKLYKRVGYLPVRMSAVNSLEMKSFIRENPNFAVPIEELPYSRALPYHKEYYKINQTLIDMFERIIYEGSDPVIELETTENTINQMLE